MTNHLKNVMISLKKRLQKEQKEDNKPDMALYIGHKKYPLELPVMELILSLTDERDYWQA